MLQPFQLTADKSPNFSWPLDQHFHDRLALGFRSIPLITTGILALANGNDGFIANFRRVVAVQTIFRRRQATYDLSDHSHNFSSLKPSFWDHS